MKYLSLIIIVLISCNHKKASFPLAVRDVCVGKWAVITGIDENDSLMFWGGHPNGKVTISENGISVGDDTVMAAHLGLEFQFDDSVSAINAYAIYSSKKLAAENAFRSLEGERIKRVAYYDSVFRCRHTYQVK